MTVEVYVYGSLIDINRLLTAIGDPGRISFARWGRPADDTTPCAVLHVKHYAVAAVEETGPRYTCEVYL